VGSGLSSLALPTEGTEDLFGNSRVPRHDPSLAPTAYRGEVDPQATISRATWSQFLKAHWNVIAAADFFTVEVWAPRDLVTFYVFFVIELATRKIESAGMMRFYHRTVA
jgi:hypothetical protein